MHGWEKPAVQHGDGNSFCRYNAMAASSYQQTPGYGVNALTRLKKFGAAFRLSPMRKIECRMVTEQRTRSIVQPLTRRSKKTGELYVRPAHIQNEIEKVLESSLEEAFEAARSGHLYPQTLVHLLRNYRPNGRSQSHDGLVVAFFSRLERAGKGLVRHLSTTQREWVEGEVVTRILEWLPTDRMDIFEISFKLAAERLYYTEIAKVLLRTSAEVAFEDLVEPGSDLKAQDVADGILARRAGPPTPLAEVRAELGEAMSKLTERERLAAIYVEAFGLEHDDAGKQMGCSGRNIRYLLKSAQAKTRGEKAGARVSARGKERP